MKWARGMGGGGWGGEQLFNNGHFSMNTVYNLLCRHSQSSSDALVIYVTVFIKLSKVSMTSPQHY